MLRQERIFASRMAVIGPFGAIILQSHRQKTLDKPVKRL